MKKILITATVCTLSLLLGATIFKTIQNKIFASKSTIEFKTGDIIYQSSDHAQSKAVKLATHSLYSHVGMIIKNQKGMFVLEAVQPVQMIPLNEWIARDPQKKYCVQRLKDSINLDAKTQKLDSIAKTMIGKNYDLLFEWSDEKLYCSELVWKVYKEAYNIQLSELKKLKDFDLTHPYVQKMLEQRYGKNLPLEQNVVSPQDLYDSKLLHTIFDNTK